METFEISANSLNLSGCMRKYDYSKLQSLVPAHRGEAIEKGTVVHEMLADYYRGKIANVPHFDLIERGIEVGRRMIVETELDIADTEELIVKSFREYCMRWKDDVWIPIAVEAPFSLVLHEDEELRIVFNGKMDLIVENPLQEGKRFIVDHKTGSRNKQPISLTNQAQGYCVAGQTAYFIINRFGFQKTLPPEKKFVRHSIQFNRAVLDEWKYWTVYRAKMIHAYIKAGVFPPDYTQCDKWSGCEFLPICDGEPQAREWKKGADFRVKERPELYATDEEE